jgi:hypothetical protein
VARDGRVQHLKTIVINRAACAQQTKPPPPPKLPLLTTLNPLKNVNTRSSSIKRGPFRFKETSSLMPPVLLLLHLFRSADAAACSHANSREWVRVAVMDGDAFPLCERRSRRANTKHSKSLRFGRAKWNVKSDTHDGYACTVHYVRGQNTFSICQCWVYVLKSCSKMRSNK